MVKSPKSGRELGGETADKAPSFLRRLLGHAHEPADKAGGSNE
jgi:hypothetical protein